MKQISFFESERQLTKQERKIKRLWTLAIFLFLIFTGSNAMWIVYRFMLEVK